ncbi:MAG: HAD domain-containing protein, partial [Proteobacteria bacterium]|nr:HAD domain-containing protein [Pseudomonadota bacterium]
MGKVLILDFDGVLNNEPYLRRQKNHPSGYRVFDPKNIASLNSLVETIKFDQIVVSSSWKK